MASHPPPFGGGYGDERGDPGAFVVEDLTQGLNEWRNIQDIVRLSFVAFHKALQAQGDAIQALTEQTELRALKSDVRAAFETHEELLEVRLGDAEAADAGDAETPNAEIRDAEILERVAALERRAETVETRLDRFATKAELEKASEETRTKLDALLRDLRRDNGGDADARRDAEAATVHAPPPRDDAVRTAFESDRSLLSDDSSDDRRRERPSPNVGSIERTSSFCFCFKRFACSWFIQRQKLIVSGSWWPFAPNASARESVSARANAPLNPITGHHALYTNPSWPTQPVPFICAGDRGSPGMRQRFFHLPVTRSTCATTSTGDVAKAAASLSEKAPETSEGAEGSPTRRASRSSSPAVGRTLDSLSSPNTSTSRTRDSGVETRRNRNTSAQFPVNTTSSSTYHAKA